MTASNSWVRLLALKTKVVNAPDRTVALQALDVDDSTFNLGTDVLEAAMFIAAADQLAASIGAIVLCISVEGEPGTILGFGTDAQDARQRMIWHFGRRHQSAMLDGLNPENPGAGFVSDARATAARARYDD